VQAELIDRIYQAAVIPNSWPGLLQEIADAVGAIGGHMLFRSPTRIDAVASPVIERDLEDYFAQGWGQGPSEHTSALLAEMAPGFRAEVDYHTAEEIARMPVHADFLDPRGYIAGVATVVQGSGDFVIQFALEGFPSHEAALRAVPILDSIRPDLARALSLTSLRRSRAEAAVVESLALAGAAAAIVSRDGKLRSANDRFVARLGSRMMEIGGRLLITNRFFSEQLAAALAQHQESGRAIRSIPIAGEGDGRPFAIHLLPITGPARDLCDADGVLLLISEGVNASVPDADLLRALFDLTPGEARLARGLVSGMSLEETATLLGIKKQTARTHLRAIFGKTGVSRQAALVLLLSGFGKPAL
jgi:DNA-binding CsgD family transcriptional regulator